MDSPLNYLSTDRRRYNILYLPIPVGNNEDTHGPDGITLHEEI